MLSLLSAQDKNDPDSRDERVRTIVSFFPLGGCFNISFVVPAQLCVVVSVPKCNTGAYVHISLALSLLCNHVKTKMQAGSGKK